MWGPPATATPLADNPASAPSQVDVAPLAGAMRWCRYYAAPLQLRRHAEKGEDENDALRAHHACCGEEKGEERHHYC